MDRTQQPLEKLLTETLNKAGADGCPPRLKAALEWAVFPGGARIRPRLCQAVAAACGGSAEISVVPAAALELLHCASLVHDDLPCFDNADVRRGKPSVHIKFDERLAVLAGDSLIVLAFEMLSDRMQVNPLLAGRLIAAVAKGVGAPSGIAAGQAWECEDSVDLSVYHRAKTGSLFAAATEAGAIAAGVAASADWAELGIRLGQAYQVADDILDAAGRTEDVGKPVRQDERFSRPNSVEQHGLSGAAQQLRGMVDSAINSIPECAGRAALCAQMKSETDRLLPAELVAELAA